MEIGRKMGPKRPVRIGLIKKSNKESDDFSDEGDELMSQAVSVADETMPPLSESAMEELESLVSTPDDIFADEIELDNDPDYVPKPDNQQPSTSRSVPKAKSSATATATTSSVSELPKPLPGGRSSAPIWAYYIADDKKVNGHLEKGAICQINVGGGICGKRILQNGSTTTTAPYKDNHLTSTYANCRLFRVLTGYRNASQK